MKKVLRKITGQTYKHLVKPVLFKLPPDSVHEGMIRSANVTQKLGFINPIFRALWAHEDEPMLAQSVFGMKFASPLGLSAGLDKNANLPPTMKAVGFGFATVGSITAKAAPGNPRPWFYRLPKTKSLVVNAGLPNIGADLISRRLQNYPSRLFEDFPLVASVAKTNSMDTNTDEKGVADYIEGFKKLRGNPHIAMFEINISCPNTFGGEPFTRPEPLETLLMKVDELKLMQPVVIKMPISLEWKDFDELLKVIVRHNIHGVTIGNLQKNRSHVELKDDMPDSVKGNLSGKACFDDSNELISRTYEKYGDELTVIGVGGVFTAEDAYEKIKRGATLVEMVTGLIFNGPQVVGEINHGLAEILKRDGYTNVSEAIGSAHR